MPLSQAPVPDAVDSTRVDVAVIGAGPAGATAALYLAAHGVRVLLVERLPRRPISIGESLPPSARPVLASLGLWDQFVAAGHLPCYGNRSAWGSPELAATDFIFDPYGHGWHLDRTAFDAMLVAAAQDHGARARCAISATWRADATGGALWLRQATGAILVRAEAILDCTGRAAAVAQRQGARRIHYDKLVAIAALHTARASADVDSTTLVEAGPDGWWYTALLPSNRRVFVYFTDGDLVDVASVRHPASWLRRLSLTQHLWDIHQRFQYEISTGPALFPAASSMLEPAGQRHWLAAGDAAITFDPLSSQGILTAITSGRAAASAILGVLNGRPESVAGYQAYIERMAREYLDRREQLYAHETRWPNSPFWRRRTNSLIKGGHYALGNVRRQAGRDDRTQGGPEPRGSADTQWPVVSSGTRAWPGGGGLGRLGVGARIP